MFETVIGLEVHVQLNTKTKIFCSCPTSFGDEPNKNTCPVCLALPGALPVLNKEAVKKAISFGIAINATINQNSIFARKNYFYPDLPKAYQISQFEKPIIENGQIRIELEDGNHKNIRIIRAHLEEDAGKNIHELNYSKIDLNRAGTPLLEIVSAPEMYSSAEAVAYLKKLHSIVRYLGISDANMQEGSFRCDANVSIRPKGDNKLYTRVEIKNLNSFRFIQKAIEYEVERQIDAWQSGRYEKEVIQETRLFDVDRGITKSMRDKEESSDYRYFPDPDLLPLTIPHELLHEASNIPELPDEKFDRYVREYGIKEYDASIITATPEMAHFFETMISNGASIKNSVPWLTSELLGRLKTTPIEKSPVDAKKLAELVKRIDDNTISGKGAKEVLDYLFEKDSSASIDELITKLGLKQISDDSAIIEVINKILTTHSDKVAEYKAGKEKLFGFFVGQIMKELRGANPTKVNELLKEKLNG